MIKKLLSICKIYGIAIKNTFDDEGTTKAAALSFYAFFSLFPLILIFFSILGFFVDSPDISRKAALFLKDFFPASISSIERSIAYSISSKHKLGVIGFLILLSSAVYFFTALEEAINKAWKVKSERHFIRKKFLSFAVMFIAGIILLTSISSMSFIYMLSGFTIIPDLVNGIFPMQDLIYEILTSLTSFLLFLSFYKFLPNTQVTFREILPGTVITALMWEILLNGFTFFIRSFTDYKALYGPVTTLITILSWIYVSCFIIIIGAEFCSEYAREKRER